jgi:1,4-dihydroxy-2-naphthoate octaprenyltransferase
METFNIATLIIIGVYLIGGALIIKTSNFRSSLLFKVIPFFLGLGSLLVLNNLLKIVPYN